MSGLARWHVSVYVGLEVSASCVGEMVGSEDWKSIDSVDGKITEFVDSSVVASDKGNVDVSDDGKVAVSNGVWELIGSA